MSQLPKFLAEACEKKLKDMWSTDEGFGFRDGASWLYAHLLSLETGKFDENVAVVAGLSNTEKVLSYETYKSITNIFADGARWQHSQGAAQIAALKALVASHNLDEREVMSRFLHEARMAEKDAQIAALKFELQDAKYNWEHFADLSKERCQDAQVQAEQIRKLRLVLVKLANETSGLLSAHEMALSMDGGNTNAACLRIRIREAREALAETIADEKCNRSDE